MSDEVAQAPMEQDAPAPVRAKIPESDPRLRSIRIKTGSVKRLAKDLQYYEKDLVANNAKVDKMKEEGKDAKEIAHAIDIRDETLKVMPDVKRRLKAAHEELKNVIDLETELKEEELYKAAEIVLNEVQPMVAD